ncbi:MAG: hypothetical protein ABI759_08345 [Candidatus Solibacter sp.]
MKKIGTLGCVFLAGLLSAVTLPLYGEIRILAITSAANFATGTLLPGSLASVFCTGLQVPALATPDGMPLPRTLAGVKVTVQGVDAPILAIASLAGGTYQQINVQLPWELPVSLTSPAYGVVTQGDASGHFLWSGFTGLWPVFFSNVAGYAVAQHASDLRLVTPADPARPGEWIAVYATNLGPVANQPADGYPAPTQPLAAVAPTPTSYRYYFGPVVGDSGSYTSTRLASNYMGLVPGLAGLYQVNVQVPGGQPSGDLVFQIVDLWDCGFFFSQSCGRSLVTAAASMAAKIPVGN